MKKKIALLLSVLSVVMMLGACGVVDYTTLYDYTGYTYDDLHTESIVLGTALAEASYEEVEMEVSYLQQNVTEETVLLVDLCEKWMAAMDVSGNFVDVAENGFTVTKSGNKIITDLVLVFEERNVIFQLVYNYQDMELTGVNINPVYSFGEKISMNSGIFVFAVLIVISCFKIFPYLKAKKREKEAALKTGEVKTDVVTQIEQREQSEEQATIDDTESVAIIAADVQETVPAEEVSATQQTAPVEAIQSTQRTQPAEATQSTQSAEAIQSTQEGTIPLFFEEETDTVDEKQESSSYRALRWQICGLAGDYAGASFPIDGTLQIGRNPNAQVAYSQNAKRISKVHCQLLEEDGRIYIRDENSTNGTFLGKGIRLEPEVNYCLEEGDVFYLAEVEQRFCLKKG